ncbi:hypothetical protein KUV80_13200 [Fictibacillus nanhaiensis]|uniref:hypothetical protein n=1 Tax=Fictibacillus nanhaiensis TaxID=742169 RepID=UPI001C97CF0D|nr:hypothetical protein [Fictibacillus nanhaiensis]MBY6037620.1 hypothetical protein [Fictibacillus nanhaiensis]
MSSGCNSNHHHVDSCKGCVCSILRDAAKAPFNPCQRGTQTFTILFGDPTLDIGGLIFKGLDDKTCCATFTDFEGNVYVFDCRKLDGISCTVFIDEDMNNGIA